MRRNGPLNLGELKQIYQGGKLNDESYLWTDGMGEEFKQLKSENGELWRKVELVLVV